VNLFFFDLYTTILLLLARIRETEQRSIAALRLASEPEVSSKSLDEAEAVAFKDGKIVRSMADSSDDYSPPISTTAIRSHGAWLKFSP